MCVSNYYFGEILSYCILKLLPLSSCILSMFLFNKFILLIKKKIIFTSQSEIILNNHVLVHIQAMFSTTVELLLVLVALTCGTPNAGNYPIPEVGDFN